MRKFLAFAALVLGLAACQTEPEGLNVTMGGEQEVTISVAIPEVETRAGDVNSAQGAIANGIVAMDDYTIRYALQIFDKDGNASKEIIYKYSDTETVSFPVRLVPEREYTFVVWADIVAAAGVQDGVKSADLRYAIGATLEDISIIEGEWRAMDETRDAFTGKTTLTFNGNNNIDIDLYRPFAKLRVVTTDYNELAKFDITPTYAVVKYDTPHYAKFNAYESKAVPTNTNAINDKEHSYTIIEWTTEDNSQRTLFADYFFAEDGDIVKFDMSVYEDAAKTKLIKYNNFNTDINVKRNHLTTLKGDILTTGGNVIVTVKPGLEETVKEYKEANSAQDIKNAIDEAEDGKETVIVIGGDIDLGDLFSAGTLSSTRAATANTITIAEGKAITLDLNGFTLSHNNSVSDKNNDGKIDSKDNAVMFDVRGTMTIQNGTVTFQHTGDNFGWNACTELFYVGFNGTLNVKDSTIKNLGGSDMAYCIDLVNATNVTLNVENSTLESTYIPVRIFNNGGGMNNVTIKESTLKGTSRALWVHIYSSKDNSGKGIKDYTLNLDFFGNGNTFTANNPNRIIEFGFDDEINFDAEGNLLVSDADDLAYAVENGHNVLFLEDIEIAKTLTLTAKSAAMTINGNNKKLTYTGSNNNRIIEASKEITADLTINDLEIYSSASYCQRGINFNNSGKLTLNNVKISGDNLTYALNFPAMSSNAKIEINDSYVKGNIALNIWGQNVVANITNSELYNTDETDAENYSTIVLNNDGTTIAEGTIVNITGGKVISRDQNGNAWNIVLNNTFTGDVYISDSTEVVGTIVANVAIVRYNGYDEFYSCTTLARAIETASGDDNATVVLLRNVELGKTITINKNINIDGNGKTITMSEDGKNDIALFDISGCKATIKNVVFDGIKQGAVVRTVDVDFEADNVTVQNCEHKVGEGIFRLRGKNTIKNSTFKNNTSAQGLIVTLNFDGANPELPSVVENCIFEGNTANSSAVLYYVKGSSCTINGNKFVGNTVNCSGNGATIYMGFQENCTVTNNLFQNNTTNEAEDSSRVAGGIFFGYELLDFTGNAFINNKVTGTNAVAKDVCVSTYYTSIDLSGNYWGGDAPVEDSNYYVQHKSDERVVTISNYLTENPIK